jgi:hypothetical protein
LTCKLQERVQEESGFCGYNDGERFKHQ